MLGGEESGGNVWRFQIFSLILWRLFSDGGQGDADRNSGGAILLEMTFANVCF